MKIRSVICLISSLACFVLINTSSAVELDEVIVIVNDEAITKSEYEVRYRRQQLQESDSTGTVPKQIDISILRKLIDERIQSQLAVAAGIKISPEEIEQSIEILALQNNISPNELIQGLADQGISPKQLYRSIEEQKLIQRIIDAAVHSRVTVSEQEIDYYLQSHKEIYLPDKSYEISHLYVSTTGKSEEEISKELENVEFIYAELQQGGNFEFSVKQFSDGDNKEEGGYLGWRNEDQLPELFLTSLRNTPIGGITDILESSNGFHILKLHAKQGDVKIVTQQLIRHILIQPQSREITKEETLKLISQISDEIKSTGDFEKYARLHSDDEVSALEGGSLGWVNPGESAPRLEKATSDLPLNQLSDPVLTRFGYHLIEVLDRRKKDISQELARKEAQQEIFKRKSTELYQDWFDQVRDSAYIEYVSDNNI